MERTLLFVDYANINANRIKNGYSFDYSDFINYIAEGRFLVDAYLYMPIDPRNEHKKDMLIEDLWLSGYLVNKKIGTIAGNTYKCDFDVEITMDITNAIHQIKPDIVVLASGDSDFIPLITELRKRGVRVEVASFKSSASRDMILRSSGFIDLDIYCSETEDSEDGIVYEETTYGKQDLINEYNDTDNSIEDLEEKTRKNEEIKKKIDEGIKANKIIKEKLNKPLVEEFEIDKKEDLSKVENSMSNKAQVTKLEEVDIDIEINNYDDPWDWE